MLSSYLNTAIRTLLKSKTHTLINVFGLAFGIACVFVIVLYLRVELSYDRFHYKPENLYRITWGDANPQTRTPHPMAQALKRDFPEVESAVSLTPLFAAGLTRETHTFRNPATDNWYDEKNILSVDTTFFDVFSFPLVKGNQQTALKQVDGLLISESMAQKYFPDEDPIGKHLAVDGSASLVEVTGVFKDVPHNAHFHFDFLVSYLREKSFDSGDAFYSWADFGHYNYIRLHDGADPMELERKLMAWVRNYIEVPDATYRAMLDQGYGFRLQPVTDIHLHSHLRWELEPNGNVEYVYILAAAALLTLVIACVNFTNLTTAKSAERAKEIGVRKALGAGQHQLSLQFLGESVFMALIAIIVAVLIIELALPLLAAFTAMSFDVDYIADGLILLGLGLFIGLLAGVYPAAYLAKSRPHLVLKGRMVQTPKGASLRRGLIVFQFFMSMVLVSSAVIIYSQLDFLVNKDPGFDKEAVMVIPVKRESGVDRFEALQHELQQINGVRAVSASSNLPGGQFNQHGIASPDFPDDNVPASEIFVDYDFFSTLDIPLAAGRTFLRENAADSSGAYILNEAAVRELHLEPPVIGKEILWIKRERNSIERGTVVGVVKDFNFQSFHDPIRPLIFVPSENQFNYIVLRLDARHLSDKIASIERVYKTFEPVYGFEYTFLDDRLAAQYESEQHTGFILGAFTAIAILIACLGLFGMSLLTFQQRIKELSVRKILGATAGSVLLLFVRDFTRLILVAAVLGTPLAWWIMRKWLENFSYRITIHPVVFIASGLLLIALAWLTLSYFTVRASRLNPARTLRSE